ncbi:beta-galactosidase [Schaalia sp. ZJ1691]|uniref:beta-galactosidase n=1 Tax=Schaalia sp. ZJ1691 TaxID=2709404 RepID=UPI0013EC957C|nr:beta-galactosidase [Schaalia sp. ZJ1691]
MYPQEPSTSPLSPSSLPLLYGGDWNPEQWDESTINEDIALMHEAGINCVTLGVFSWAKLEPTEGRYDFEWMRSILDRLHDEDILVDLATGTASPPAWMATHYPHTLPVDSRGVRLGFGSRQQYCPSSNVFRERVRSLAHAIAKEFADHPAVFMWHISNEYGCHTFECFCDSCARQFRQWLTSRYRTIDALNETWGTNFWSQKYLSFDDITPPRAMPTFHNPSQALDWRRFNDDQLLSLYLSEKEEIRKFSKLPVTTNFMGDFPMLNYFRWAQHVDIISHDSYPDPSDPHAAHDIAWSGDLMRGLSRGKPWLLMEQAPNAVQWRTRNAPKRPGQFQLWSLAHMAHGADGILQFQIRQSVLGAETFHSGMIPHAGKKSRTWNEVVSTGSLLRELHEIKDQLSPARVAILIDWESLWAREVALSTDNSTHGFTRAKAWHQTFWEANIPVDIIDKNSDLTAYDIVILADHFIDDSQLTKTLTSAVSQGTHLLVEGPCAIVNNHMKAIQGGYLGSMRELLGVAVADFVTLASGSEPQQPSESSRTNAFNRITRGISTPTGERWVGLTPLGQSLQRSLDRMGTPSPDLRGGDWAEELIPWASSWEDSTVDIVATFDGRGGGKDLAHAPAITRNVLGTGAAWYSACTLDSLSRHALAAVLCAHTRVIPTINGLPDGVEAQERGQFLILLNHADSSVELTGITGEDIISGNECNGHVILSPRSAMVIRRPLS